MSDYIIFIKNQLSDYFYEKFKIKKPNRTNSYV